MPLYNFSFTAKTNERMKMFHVTFMLGACARIIPSYFWFLLKNTCKIKFLGQDEQDEQTKEQSKLLIFIFCFVWIILQLDFKFLLLFLFLMFFVRQFSNQIKQGLLAINKHMLLCVQ